MKKILVVGKYKNGEVENFLRKIVNFLLGLNCDVFLDKDSCDLMGEDYQIAKDDKEYDLAIVIGGDGTMMGAARQWGLLGVPLLGINYGRIGFLTDLDRENVFEKLNEILSGNFKEELRDLLSVSVTNGKDVIFNEVAVNDLVVGKSVSGKLTEFSLFIDDEFIYSQYADGVIVATATGSTAYALAAGGSIIHPNGGVFHIVPICPQKLSNRPLVIGTDVKIKLFGSGKDGLSWNVDGVEQEAIKGGFHFEIVKNPKKIKLIHPLSYSYFEGLRTKLDWC